MLGRVEVNDAPPMVGEDDQDEEDAQVSGGHGEEVDRDQVLEPGPILRAPTALSHEEIPDAPH
jgi:ribosomal protein L16 Arg81 hydroxylase